MDFAPYQSSTPENTRSPTGTTPRASLDYAARRTSFSPLPSHSPFLPPPNYNYQQQSDHLFSPPLQHPQPQRGWLTSRLSLPGAFPGADDSREALVEFETSLGLRLDYEACLAYLIFPPAGAVILLALERKSDYVRFHAWQSSLLFSAIVLLHVLLLWSSFFSSFLMLAELAAIAWLTFRAYQDADSLERYEVPFVGPFASKILDDE
ncbi:hypothetical protein Cpir12675_002564 [Ceratocystis pirilliformis]|uniref:Uncharacterized protein n=1 Tax=Ceratocystis pirilliformis TaxID=259994 RepID=A0ABR3ZAW9_9PEZI